MYFSQFIDKYLKIEEMEYLIHYVKFKIKFPLFLQHFWILVLRCTLFTPIYTEIDNWDLNVALGWTFQFFHDQRDKKNSSFLD